MLTFNWRGSELRDDNRKQPNKPNHTSPNRQLFPAYDSPSLPHRRQFLNSVFTMPATTAETLSLVSRNVTVAPLVLLSVVDHYNRTEAFKSKTKRVVGVLLGHNEGDNVRVSNSFAGEQHRPQVRGPMAS